MPEQPPPTTRILRANSGLPSSSRRSEIFFAAVSVSEIMHSSLKVDAGSIVQRTRLSIAERQAPWSPSEDAVLRQEGDLLERGPRLQGRHEQGGPGHLLGPDHPGARGRIRDGIPQWRVGRPGREDADADAVGAHLLREHARKAEEAILARGIGGAARQGPAGHDRADINDGASARGIIAGST